MRATTNVILVALRDGFFAGSALSSTRTTRRASTRRASGRDGALTLLLQTQRAGQTGQQQERSTRQRHRAGPESGENARLNQS